MGALSGVRPRRLATTTAPRGRRCAPWVIGTLLSAAVLMFCYLRIAGADQVNSDGGGMVWQAWDVLHGNVLLHGWWAADVSFYTTELPEYLVVTAADSSVPMTHGARLRTRPVKAVAGRRCLTALSAPTSRSYPKAGLR